MNFASPVSQRVRHHAAGLLAAASAVLLPTAIPQTAPGAQPADNHYPELILRTPALTARLYLPNPTNGYYRGTRFDWSGLIARVESGGHTFFAEFKQEHDPLNHDDICGTAEEFGIESAPSFDQARPGAAFIKIGVGVLERPDASAYAFWKRYKVLRAGEWEQKSAPGKIEFRQSLSGLAGWSYEYTKTIELSQTAQELKIIRHLRNTGTQTIDTDHYDHNFLRIDDIPAGTNYELQFRFAPRFGKDSKTQNCVGLKEQSLIFTKEPAADQAIWVRLEGFDRPQDNWIRILNHATGAGMTVSTDRPLSKLVFYSSGGVLCPEAFVRVHLAPGQSQDWTTIYHFESRVGE